MTLIKNVISRRTPFSIIILSAVFVGLMGCGILGGNDDGDGGNGDGDGNGNGNEDATVVQVMQGDDDLSIFSQAITDAGLEGEFEAEGSFTVFAPTNAAFDDLPDGFLESLSQEELAAFVSYHFIPSEIPSGDFSNAQSIQTVQEDSVFVTINGEVIEVNKNSLVTGADIEASNGTIHKIDQVLLPDAYLDVFEIMWKRYYTHKFACTCTSGRTGLEAVLKSTDAEFTVFAPTDAAFENREEDVDALSDDELRSLMNYHIIDQKILSGELTDGQTLTTRNGADITVSVADDGTISLNGGAAVVQMADLEGTNGVVYVIGTVLTPPDSM